MSEEGFVSLWVGQARSPDDLEEYLQTGYTEDGDVISSAFARNFGIGHYDEDFREAEYYERPSQSIRSLLQGYSYDSVIIPKFVRLSGESLPIPVNAIVLLYNFKYEGGVEGDSGESVRMRYIGSVTLD